MTQPSTRVVPFSSAVVENSHSALDTAEQQNDLCLIQAIPMSLSSPTNHMRRLVLDPRGQDHLLSRSDTSARSRSDSAAPFAAGLSRNDRHIILAPTARAAIGPTESCTRTK